MVHEAYVALGNAAITETRYEEAASFYARAVQSSPKTGTHYLLQAIALALAGRLAEARSLAKRGLELEAAISRWLVMWNLYASARRQVCRSGPLAGASGIALIERRGAPYAARSRCRTVLSSAPLANSGASTSAFASLSASSWDRRQPVWTALRNFPYESDSCLSLAVSVGSQSAQLRRPRPRSATGALRRFAAFRFWRRTAASGRFRLSDRPVGGVPSVRFAPLCARFK